LRPLDVPAVYYIGRFLQLLGMWLLLVDLFTAGPFGPNPRLFGVGVVMFVVGWLLARRRGN
jgi:uncharacterized membrane protein YtjA (UPF0391 family)